MSLLFFVYCSICFPLIFPFILHKNAWKFSLQFQFLYQSNFMIYPLRLTPRLEIILPDKKKIRAIADSLLALQTGIEGQASLKKFIRAAYCHVNFGNLQLDDADAATVRVQRSDDRTAWRTRKHLSKCPGICPFEGVRRVALIPPCNYARQRRIQRAPFASIRTEVKPVGRDDDERRQ